MQFQLMGERRMLGDITKNSLAVQTEHAIKRGEAVYLLDDRPSLLVVIEIIRFWIQVVKRMPRLGSRNMVRRSVIR